MLSGWFILAQARGRIQYSTLNLPQTPDLTLSHAGVACHCQLRREDIMYRILALAVILLAGCVSPEEAAYNRQLQAEQAEQNRAAYRARLASNCDSMGFKRGTDAHANCILSQHQQKQQELSQLLPLLIQQQQQQQRPIYTPIPSLPPLKPTYNTNCTRDYQGNLHCTTQ